MDEAGVCQSCGEKLVGIDIDPRETENFASSLTKLACQREVKADFGIDIQFLKIEVETNIIVFKGQSL